MYDGHGRAILAGFRSDFGMTVGTEFRQAREQAGLSAEQIGNRIKVQLYKIEALENNDFDSLPQGIYLDGIVRAYAREVGIDPEPMVERVRRQRGKLPGDWEVPFAAPIDLRDASHAHEFNILELPDGHDPLDAFTAESDNFSFVIPGGTQETPPPVEPEDHILPERSEPHVPRVTRVAPIGPVTTPTAPIRSPHRRTRCTHRTYCTPSQLAHSSHPSPIAPATTLAIVPS